MQGVHPNPELPAVAPARRWSRRRVRIIVEAIGSVSGVLSLIWAIFIWCQ